MNRKKQIMIIAATCVAVITMIIVAVCCIRKGNKKVNSENIVKHEDCDFTRAEWLELLCEKVGVADYENVNYVQAAVEWGIIPEAENFYGDYCVSGEFVALTTMKSVGEEKVQIYLETSDEITDEDYLQAGIDAGIITEEEQSKCFSLDDAQRVLNKYDDIYFSEFWKDNYENIEFSDSALEIFEEEILDINEDCSEIVVADHLIEEISEGQALIFDYGNTGLKCARKVESVSEDGTVALSDEVVLEDVFETLVVSDVNEVTFEDIANYYGVTLNEEDSFINTKMFDKEINSEGFKINLQVDDESELSVKITDNASGCWFELPLAIDLKDNVECNVEVDIDKINIGAQVNYKVFGGLKSADVAIESHANVSGELLGFDVEKKIPLYETVTPIGNGYVGVDIGVYMVLTAEGTISFEVEMPMEASINYQKGKGIKDHSFNIDVENPVIEGDCTAGVSVQFEPTLVILMVIDVVDVQTDIGIGAHANVKVRPGSQTCTDISVYYPTFSISVCGDDKADTLLGALGISAGWEIIDEDNAPFKMKLHHEILKDGKMQFVDECTYVEDEEEETKEESETESENETEGNTENEQETTTGEVIPEENFIDFSLAYGRKYVVEFIFQKCYATEKGWIISGTASFHDYVPNIHMVSFKNGDIIKVPSGRIYEVVSNYTGTMTDRSFLGDGGPETNDYTVYELCLDGTKYALSYEYNYREGYGPLRGNLNGYICHMSIWDLNLIQDERGSFLIPYSSELSKIVSNEVLPSSLLLMFDETGNIDRYLVYGDWTEEKEKEFYNVQ